MLDSLGDIPPMFITAYAIAVALDFAKPKEDEKAVGQESADAFLAAFGSTGSMGGASGF